MKRTLIIVLIASALGACAWIRRGPGEWDFWHQDCWLREKSGYGVSLTGKNCSQAELFDEIRLLAAAYRVPVEIIAGVMEQESRGEQYGDDGVFVHNRRECSGLFAGSRRESSGPPGLGLMQLTGATARAFDVPRLITDWRYNLRAGVEVLDAKYKRVYRDDPPEMQAILESNRDILENWYYGVLAYNGFVPRSVYPARVCAHIASPGVRFRGLFTPVALTSPEAVIPGFIAEHRPDNFTPFAIQRDGTWLLLDGAVTAPIHFTQSAWATSEITAPPVSAEVTRAAPRETEPAVVASDARRRRGRGPPSR